MSHLTVWKILEEMIVDFRERGSVVPTDVMRNLKSARTMITVAKTATSQADVTQRIEEYLRSVESYLVSEGEKKFGTEYVDEWLKRLGEAGKATLEEGEETRFVSGLPREQKCIRISPSVDLAVEKLKALAKDSNITFNLQKNGSFLACGKEEHIKDFVKKMATEYRLKTEK